MDQDTPGLWIKLEFELIMNENRQLWVTMVIIILYKVKASLIKYYNSIDTFRKAFKTSMCSARLC